MAEYKVVAPWVGGPKKGEILTKAEAEKSGDTVAHLIHTGNIEEVGEAPKAPATARKRPSRAEQRAAKAVKAQAATTTGVHAESAALESK